MSRSGGARRLLPSLPTSIALLALAIATTGTAAAATGQLVNVVDPTNAANKAKVDAGGNLRVLATGALPAKPLLRDLYLFAGGMDNSVVAASTATVALTRLAASNSMDQLESRGTRVELLQRASAADGSCTGPATVLTAYQVPAGETVLDALPVPLVLKPVPGYPQWCLVVRGYMQGGATSYVLPRLNVQGYVVSGTVPTAASATASTDSGAWPRSDGAG